MGREPTEMGLPHLMVYATTAAHAIILGKIGVDKVILAEQETAVRVTHSFIIVGLTSILLWHNQPGGDLGRTGLAIQIRIRTSFWSRPNESTTTNTRALPMRQVSVRICVPTYGRDRRQG